MAICRLRWHGAGGKAGGSEAMTPSRRYSAFSLARHALSNAPWPRAWRAAEPKSSYDVVIVGGGGHGLATAHYLAANHGIRNVAVLERAYVGSGNVGRNTTIVRSNYVIDGNTQFFEYSLKLWEGLSQALNFNVMLSQRGQIVLGHSPLQLDVLARKGNIMRLNGIDAELLDRGQVMRLLPYLDYSAEARFPIWGGLLQRRAGTARHDAVAWGYARAADAQGVDIIENCEVQGFLIRDGSVYGVETNRGRILAGRDRYRRGRPFIARCRDGGSQTADREPLAAGFRVGADQTVRGPRDLVRRGVLLYLPVRQGRSRIRRPYRRLQQLHAEGPVPQGAERGGECAWRSSLRSHDCDCCVTGRAFRT